jgi:two-component system, chemotaxis family, response regulator Rcp1
VEQTLVRLFGPLQVELPGRCLGPRDLGGLKPKQIFEILLLTGDRMVPKDRLAASLWGERLPRNVSATIETYISKLRRHLGRDHGHALVVTGSESYGIAKGAVVRDIDRFDKAVERAQRTDAPARRRALLEDGLGLVRGHLLEDEPYASWGDHVREHYRRRVLDTRLDAAHAALIDGDARASVAHAQQALEADPLEERAHRMVVLAWFVLGARHEALRAYRSCRQVLADELGMDPHRETDLLQDAILRDVDPATIVAGLPAPGPRAARSTLPGVPFLHRRAMRILLVDDNPAHVGLIREALTTGSIPAQLDHAGDADEAMRQLRRSQSRDRLPDLILLDLHLPGRSGLDVLAEVRADVGLRRLPVLVLTASSADADVVRSYDLHANGYITKPADLDDFVAVVRTIEAFWPLTAPPPVPYSF